MLPKRSRFGHELLQVVAQLALSAHGVDLSRGLEAKANVASEAQALPVAPAESLLPGVEHGRLAKEGLLGLHRDKNDIK